jgi:predicted enzyme related to lactoylglutathione lyase
LREGGCTWPGFVVANLHATLDALRALGGELVAGPEERPWGMRAVVADPDRRPVELWSES